MDRPGRRRGHHRRRDPAGRRGSLIDRVLEALTGLPPEGVYGIIAVLAALENIFPPVPADTAVALGAFLAAHVGTVTVWGVYGVTLVANLSSTIGMYLLARRVGRPFFDSKAGRRLLSRRTLRRIDRLYERHHLWGLFLSRFLPGYRALVPPFAAIAGIPARRAIPPLALATAIWYGILVWLAWRVGANWDTVRALLARLGTWLGVAALVATVAIAWLVWRHRRAAPDA